MSKDINKLHYDNGFLMGRESVHKEIEKALNSTGCQTLEKLIGRYNMMESQWDDAISNIETLILKQHKALEGTGCQTVMELREKCDWAMNNVDFNQWDIIMFQCTHCESSEPNKHHDDCEYKKNYYEKRIKK